jgi:hypothetical protein
LLKESATDGWFEEEECSKEISQNLFNLVTAGFETITHEMKMACNT